MFLICIIQYGSDKPHVATEHLKGGWSEVRWGHKLNSHWTLKTIWKGKQRTSLEVQWLGLHAFTAKDASSIPGPGTKIPQATWPKNKQMERKAKYI